MAAANDTGDCIAFNDTAFTGNLSVKAGVAGEQVEITAWSLMVRGAAATVAIQGLSGDAAAMALLDSTTTPDRWTCTLGAGSGILSAIAGAIAVNGGAASCKLWGFIKYRIVGKR